MTKLTALFALLALSSAAFLASARSHTEFSRRYIPNHRIKDQYKRLLAEHEANPTEHTARRLSTLPVPPYNVVTTNWIPMMNCLDYDLNDATANSGATTGYAYDFLVNVMADQTMDTSQLNLICTTPEDAVAMLKNGSADFGVGHFVVNADILANGFIPSQPIFSSGLKLIGKKVYERDAWSFLYPITLEVGMAFIVMTVLVAFAIWLFEEQSVKRPFMHHVLNFNEVFYDALASYFYTNAIELKRLASKLLQWMFWFVLFVFLSLYQADLTAIYSNDYFRRNFRTLQDGINQGFKIATPSVYASYFENTVYKESIIFYDAIGEEDVLATSQRIANDLISGNITGALLEIPVADFVMSTQCDLYDVDDEYVSFDYALMFRGDIDPGFIFSFSQSIVKVNEQHSTQLVKKKYFDLSPAIDCSGQDTKISLQTMGGLWVIFACTLIISMVIFAFKKLQLFKFPQSYFPPYYQYYTPKTQVFENQLKESVDQQISQILSTYESQLKDEISSFEKGLLYTPLKTDDVKDMGDMDAQDQDGDLKIDSPHKELKLEFMGGEKPSADPEI
mmetsp:Transcript_6996/g.7907  ORF Transcript_6996/g.7907 Transcript_6996/m.7907 type:complete len:563 (+) Transcript_6996:23-1711(+)